MTTNDNIGTAAVGNDVDDTLTIDAIKKLAQSLHLSPRAMDLALFPVPPPVPTFPNNNDIRNLMYNTYSMAAIHHPKPVVLNTYGTTTPTKGMTDKKEQILDAVDDLVASFLYYDRQNDEDLPVGEIEQALNRNSLTIEDIVIRFREGLEENLTSD